MDPIIMNENIKLDFENDEDEGEELDEFHEEEEIAKKSLDLEKKNHEINLKKTQAFSLSQTKDSSINDSVWGIFKVRSSESLDIMENEPFYRTPLTNIIESSDCYFILIELPGLNKKNVEIAIQEGFLEIKGDISIKHKEKKEEKDEKHKDKKEEKKDKHKDKKDKKKEKTKEIKGEYLRREYRSPSFYRSFILPEDIDREEINASFKNGVLRLKIPKINTQSPGEKQVIEIK